MGFGFLGGGRRHHSRHHSRHSMGGSLGAIGSLGALTRPGSNAPNKEASRVVGSFIRGIRAKGACKKTKGAPAGPCEITTDGVKLKVGTKVIGTRFNNSTINVCVPAKATLITGADGKVSEAQDSKDVRAAAGALLRAVNAGIGVRTAKDGSRRIAGRKGTARVSVPEISDNGGCFEVHINRRMFEEAELMQQAAADADAEHGGDGSATKAQIASAAKKIRKARAEEAKQRRIAAAAAARAAKAAAAASAATASAPPAARAAARGGRGGRRTP